MNKMTLSTFELLLLINLLEREIKPDIYTCDVNEDYVNLLSKLTIEYARRRLEY